MADLTLTTFDWVPEPPRGFVRDLRIRWALEDLPPNLRQPSILRFYHAMPYRDIATQLHLSPVNVRKRIQQARAILRVQLQDYLVEDGAGRL